MIPLERYAELAALAGRDRWNGTAPLPAALVM